MRIAREFALLTCLLVCPLVLATPSDLTCENQWGDVELAWVNNGVYESIEILENGLLIDTIAGTATSHTADPGGLGYFCYQVCGMVAGAPQCSDECCLIHGYNVTHTIWNFEADDGGFIVQGGGWEWGTPSAGPCAAAADGRVWGTVLDGTYENSACWLLDAGSIDIGYGGDIICVDHCYETEAGWDGGVVWATTDGSTWAPVAPLEGYDGPITADPSCQWVAGQDGFTGDSGGWVTNCWELEGDVWENRLVTLRFAFGSDSSVNGYHGWMIDNVTILEWHPFHDCDYVVTPGSGTLPFTVTHRVTLANWLSGGPSWTRRKAARIDVTLAGGAHFSNWRSGYTSIAPGSGFTTQFSLALPDSGTLVGEHTFRLLVEDVTPAPYNLPPYPPAGNTCTHTTVVTAYAP